MPINFLNISQFTFICQIRLLQNKVLENTLNRTNHTCVFNLNNFFCNEISILYIKGIIACQEEIMSLHFSAVYKLHAFYISKERALSINIFKE